MGCNVTQTATTTSVTGPKTLLPLPSIDMESMTDAFMTATVLAAVARNPGDEDGNTTRITGIANQRVKECDRIAAMIEQLGRLGVLASELPDGILIHGIDRAALKNPAPIGIKCYDDHRIAMSFSVLGCAYPIDNPGPIITEKKCVEKTWPSWWDTFQNILGVKTEGVDLELHDEALGAASKLAQVDPSKTIILIGMRGAGKTHMGRAGALHLGRKFIDMDDYLEAHAKTTIPNFIKENGWDKFRALEAECLKKVMQENGRGHLIACGGGIVEGAASRDALCNWAGLVVHIKRNIDSIEKYLNIDTTRPMYGEDMRSVWNRRRPWYHSSSNAEFVVLSTDLQLTKGHYARVEKDFGRFLDFKLSGHPFSFPSSELSFFVSLTDSRIEKSLAYLNDVSSGANALELRVDLLESQDIDFVGEQLALLRSVTYLPIVFTVRTKGQGGRFDETEFDTMIALISAAIRWGCEYIDIEFSKPFDRFSSLLNSKGNSRIIASYHDPKGLDTWEESGSMVSKYRELHPLCDVIKLIGFAANLSDNFVLYKFSNEFVPALKMKDKPLIALLMGPQGQLSRSLNTFLTPVTHPALPVSAAPGQVSIAQIHSVRGGMGLLASKAFCLFGSPISSSMSPILHNSGFEALALPYHYTLSETNSWKDVKEMMKTKNGASVTIPLKVDVLENDVCDVVDPAARQIGAVNTLVKKNDQIHGFNTDWIGIRNSILRFLPSGASAIGIVLGAGGTSRAALFALSKIPQISSVKIWNRTHSKASALASEFHVQAVEDLKDLAASVSPDTILVIIGTIPSSAQSNLNLAPLFSIAKGVVVEMAYRPRETPLLGEARRSGKEWSCVEGIDVLLEQGYEQFEMWTGLQAPRHIIQKIVFEKY
jgi:pentafunctional AROM polypeptide